MRVYYIANSYDGAYFVLTDDLQEYIQRMAAYVLNLEKSGKTNHYSFGSVEMAEQEFEKHKLDALNLETSRIKAVEEAHAEEEVSDTDSTEHDGENKEPIQPESDGGDKPERGHLRLV